MPERDVELAWLEPGEPFPEPRGAWGSDSQAPGLLAAGGTLDVATLLAAYSQGIFPWFSDGQPILWWSPDPRMVLRPKNFRLHRSLRKEVQKFMRTSMCEIRIDSAFDLVIQTCASKSRQGQAGTWIVPAMVQAYMALHRAGFAHSIETWIDGELQGGLYCIAIGRAVFGESMFTHKPNASKIALTALVALCKANQVEMIDCQQNTQHLASLGASEIPRLNFMEHIAASQQHDALDWHFSPLYWQHVLSA